jgi:superfamily II DNA helicase RecQ
LPPPAVREIREDIRKVIRKIMNDPTMKEKSRAQMDTLIMVQTETRDIMIAIKMGRGKSKLWMVPSVMDEEVKSIVVCPFMALLEEQYSKAVTARLRCHNYSLSKSVLENIQILFLQVEHCSSQTFARYEQPP